ncbi:guanine nucleotide exchange protein for ADP-robosylation factor [Dimargaris cristalligena]|nr:guanine nucleotide exchange protein for ADP-robosylation factor [Dimargaris cristalligena]
MAISLSADESKPNDMTLAPPPASSPPADGEEVPTSLSLAPAVTALPATDESDAEDAASAEDPSSPTSPHLPPSPIDHEPSADEFEDAESIELGSPTETSPLPSTTASPEPPHAPMAAGIPSDPEPAEMVAAESSSSDPLPPAIDDPAGQVPSPTDDESSRPEPASTPPPPPSPLPPPVAEEAKSSPGPEETSSSRVPPPPPIQVPPPPPAVLPATPPNPVRVSAPASPQTRPRGASVSTTLTAVSTASSSMASVRFFIVNDLEKILKSRDGKRDKKLREALTRALEHLRQNQNSQTGPADTTTPSSAGGHSEAVDATELILNPLRLACATESVPAIIIALDCIEKLISYSYFENPEGGNSAPGSPVSILDQLVDIVCDCFAGEITDDMVQLQVVKAILAAVSCSSNDPAHQLHQSALLKAVRTIYNIYLLSRSESNQTLAQGTLAQIVRIVFGRIKLDTAVIESGESADPASGTAQPSPLSSPAVLKGPAKSPPASTTNPHFARNGESTPVEAALPSDKHQDSTTVNGLQEGAVESPVEDTAPRTGPANSDEPHPAELLAPVAMSVTDSDNVSQPQDSPLHPLTPMTRPPSTQSNQAGLANDQAIRDAFSLFRALCKLSMKNMTKEQYNDIRILSLRSRLLALHLIYIILNTHLDVLTRANVTLRTGNGPTEGGPSDSNPGTQPNSPAYPRDSTLGDPEGRNSLNDNVGALSQVSLPPGGDASEYVTIPFIGVVKQYLSLSLSRNLLSLDFGVFEVSLAILARLLVSLRKFMRKEIEVLFREIILPTIEMRHSAYLQRSCLIQCLLQICNDPQTLIEVYLNYDCSQDSALNLYERLVNTLSKIAAGGSGSGATNTNSGAAGSNAGTGRDGEASQYILAGPMFLPHTPGELHAGPTIPPNLTTSSVTQALLTHKEYLVPDDYSLKCQSIEAITGILRSLVSWINRGSADTSGTHPSATDADSLSARANAKSPQPSLLLDSATDAVSSGTSNPSPTPPPPSLSASASTTSLHGFNMATTGTTDDPGQFMYVKQRKQQLEDGLRLFNWKPKKGIQALIKTHFIESDTPEAIAKFLRSADGLNKTQLGEYLGEGDTKNIAIMHAFVDDMAFVNTPFVPALRNFLQDFRLPGESQKIDRFMLKFAERYVEGNPDAFANADTAYVLAYSVILLNTDQHSPQVKVRMTKADFVKNNRGINDNADLPEEFLHAIYDEIQKHEIILKDEHDPMLTGGSGGGAGSVGGAGGSGGARGGGGGKDGGVFDDGSSSLGLSSAFGVLRRRSTRYEYYSSMSREMANKSEALIKDILRKRSRLDIANEANLFYQASHIEHVRPMFEIVWMPILAGISGPAQELDDPDIIQLCLESFRHAIHIAATFDLALERDAFVSTLAKFTVLANLMEMKPKNIEAIKTLLDIAAIDGNDLNQSWLDVLTCVSQLERLQLINDGVMGGGGSSGGSPSSLLIPSSGSVDNRPRNLSVSGTSTGSALGSVGGHTSSASATGSGGSAGIPRSPGPDRGRNVPGGDRLKRSSVITAGKQRPGVTRQHRSLQLADLSRLDANSQSLVVAVDRIFSSSVKLSGTGIVEFVRALSIVSWEEIQNSTFGGHTHPRLYSLQKIVEISYYNMSRIRMEWSNVWAILGDHFNQVGCHPNVQVGFFALDSLRQLSMKFLEKEELAHFKFQKDFLRPFHFILENSPDVSIKDMVLRCLQHIIRSRSDHVRSGWKTILSVLSTAAREPSEPIVVMAFEILREVCKERFNDIVTLGSFPDLILCLTEFCTSSMHQRSSLQAIEMLYLCAKNLATRLQDPGFTTVHHQLANAAAVAVAAAGGQTPAAQRNDVSASETTMSEKGGNKAGAHHNGTVTTGGGGTTPARLAGADALPPNEDPVYRLWFPVFYAMYDIIMNCDDLEVRTKALNYLFEFLKNYGSTFSFEFWSLILRDVVYPIFRDLKSPETSQRFGRQEDITFWFSTTLIKALRNLIDLFTHYYETLCPTLDGILELLSICIAQDSETLARIGTACFQELIENNHQKFDETAWHQICRTFLNLFNTSVPHVLFEMSGRPVPTSGLNGTGSNFRPVGSNSNNGGGNGHELGGGSGDLVSALPPKPKSWKGDPQEEYQRITLKCVLQLLLIQTVDDLFHKNASIYRSLESNHLFFILDCLDKSYQFARKFNADVQLRLALVESGFMTQVPSLLKQEVNSLQCAMSILYRMYADTSSERQLIAVEVEDRLVPLSQNVFIHFNRIDPHTAERHIQAWQPVVVNILENILDMDKSQIHRQMRVLYPEFIRLLAFPRPQHLVGLIQQLLLRIGDIYQITSDGDAMDGH